MDYLRTPDERFDNLPDYDFAPNYVQVNDGQGGTLRMHYIDEGPRDSEVVLMLHGEPSWCYLYRKMIPLVVAAGYRVIAPDLIGFGRSDKPTSQDDYTYATHLAWLTDGLQQLSLTNMTLVCQDWGGLLGLRLVAEHSEWFARVLAANTMLPTGDMKPSEAFFKWKAFSQEVDVFPAAGIIKGATTKPLSQAVYDAYNAPFPDESYKAGARKFPLLVPVSPDDPETLSNRAAWQKLRAFNKPFITAFSDSDPVTAGGDKYMQANIPGCEGQAHTTIVNGGHFLQEDCAEQLSDVLIKFMKNNPLQER
ncbi:haloalkane dehalogenase [Aestuariibacter salexigens]|uniref:haloalkane dehalogenase n=1 Tax=Aestuariibacter salexigens TaxID=226010 RepID=UPI0004080288|nr:haloalkane dehalogenase [Aestuariibacter salexigens]